SNIAHELRTPIAALRGYLETLNDKALTSEKTHYFIDKAFLQSIRLSNLVEDVRLLSKIEEQNNTYSFEKVQMAQLVDNVRVNMNERLAENGTKITSTIPNTVSVKGNYNLLLSAIQNL